ncbi:MAG: helix-turn-helix transcriptional regulator [Christensenellales bacterium]|jgi:AraC-like DNA-binding protein
MRFCELRPYVRYVQTHRLVQKYVDRESIAQDGRLFYLVEGACTIHVQGSWDAVMHPSSMLLLPPGTPYKINATAKKFPILSIINFDLTLENAQQVQPMQLLSPGDSKEILPFPPVDDFPAINQPLFLSEIPMIDGALKDMEKEYAERRLFYDSRISAMMLSMLAILARANLSSQIRHPQAIDIMVSYIQNNYMRPIRNADVSNSAGYHANYANQLMLLHTGQTIRQYLIAYRMNRALELLLSTEMTVTEVAEQSGFSGLSQFSREFTTRFGNPPSKYRNRKMKTKSADK